MKLNVRDERHVFQDFLKNSVGVLIFFLTTGSLMLHNSREHTSSAFVCAPVTGLPLT